VIAACAFHESPPVAFVPSANPNHSDENQIVCNYDISIPENSLVLRWSREGRKTLLSNSPWLLPFLISSPSCFIP